MADTKEEQQAQNLKPEIRRFYLALGLFNSNMISQLIRNPERAKELTDGIIYHPGHAQECPTGSAWDDWQHVCVRMDAPAET